MHNSHSGTQINRKNSCIMCKFDDSKERNNINYTQQYLCRGIIAARLGYVHRESTKIHTLNEKTRQMLSDPWKFCMCFEYWKVNFFISSFGFHSIRFLSHTNTPKTWNNVMSFKGSFKKMLNTQHFKYNKIKINRHVLWNKMMCSRIAFEINLCYLPESKSIPGQKMILIKHRQNSS